MKKTLGILMPLVGLAIFAWIVFRTGPDRIAAILSAMDVAMLVWALPLVAAIAVTRGLRWRYVMRCVGIDYGLVRSTVVWSIGFFASAVTPAKAGDAVRAVYVRNDTGRSMGEALLTVFVDRLWDLGFVLIAGLASAVIFTRRYTDIPSAPLMVVAVGVVVIGLIVVTRRNLMRALLRPVFSVLVPARQRDGLSANFHTFYDALRVYGERPARGLVMAAMTTAPSCSEMSAPSSTPFTTGGASRSTTAVCASAPCSPMVTFAPPSPTQRE